MKKHLISIKDAADGTKKLTPAQIHEKCGDAINYLILMEAILLEEVVEIVGGIVDATIKG